MSTVPKVSAIIPTHNRAAYVSRAIDSALGQTWPNVEVIVTDDGSSDNTAEVLDAYGARIKVVTQANQGLSAARNAAIAAASGEFIAILDDDDEWLPDRLAVQMPLMLDNPDIGLAGGGMWLVDAGGALREQQQPDRQSIVELGLGDLLLANRIGCPTALIRRHALEAAGPFDTTFAYAEDYDMWVRIAGHCKVVNVPRRIARYRIWRDNKSSEENMNQALWIECHLRIRERLLLANDSLARLPHRVLEQSCLRHFRYLARHRRRQGDAAGAADLEARLQALHVRCGISPARAAMQRGLHWARRRLGVGVE